ncbi:hypothetical protein [Pantoea ananatis]|uniref:hypothetical protein n=1 Tax=Pantoea ananas TaxID=553 RepID=UPI001B314932|nr:hypothetical protein [Pantoea ananatis]
MSEACEQAYLQAVLRLKTDVDVVFAQLLKGDYARPDTFANNLHHLLRMAKEIEPSLKKPGVVDQLARTDLLLTADLLGIVSSVAIMSNFINCLSRHAGENRRRETAV